MKAVFQDLQQLDNPFNGRALESLAFLRKALEFQCDRKPFFFELHGANGFMLTIGFAGDCGSVQYSSCDGSPPYLMAISDEYTDDTEFIDFLVGNTPTPVSRRYCLPMGLVEKITSEFIGGRGKSEAVNWEEI